jgi:CheY-like chemotaxis protein
MKKSSALDPHVLLVDDNRDGLLVRRSLLEEAGCRVQVAHDGEEGLNLFKSSAFDVVITDYRMPSMNGVELIRHIRAHEPDARVILLSGFVDPLGLTEENTGADVVIPKSSREAAHLIRWVKRLLNRTERKPAARENEKQPLRMPANLSH